MLKDIKEYQAQQEAGNLSWKEVETVLEQTLVQLKERLKEKSDGTGKILLVPPDITRCYSYAGPICTYLYETLSPLYQVDVMPALGTHKEMSRQEQIQMFGTSIPQEHFLYHDWRKDTVQLGTVPASYIREISSNRYDREIAVEVDRRLVDGSYDLVVSIGQVVPHEVVGMANYSKNILVGLGGRQMINESHMLGAVCGLESIMGKVDTPVRKVFDYAEEHYLKSIPLIYVLTVTTEEEGEARIHGLFTGASRAVFERACHLASIRNINYVNQAVDKVVAYLEPGEFSSTWVGNKAIFRTRMMIRDGGELLVIAPGLERFGEHGEADNLLRKYGYRGTPYTMELVQRGIFDQAAMVCAHMIHSSSEDRFQITYAVDPAKLSLNEVEQVGYKAMDVNEALSRYPIDKLKDGLQIMENGEEVYIVKAPALGLWKVKE